MLNMIKTDKAKQCGKRLQDIAMKYLQKNVKLFNPSHEDYISDMGMIFDDACNLYAAGGMMITGNFDAAMDVASALDTVVRDAVPSSIWNYLEKYAE